VGEGRVNREGKGGQIWLMYFIYLYENNTINYVEVILRMGGGDEGE
jgi:hypothetical protein